MRISVAVLLVCLELMQDMFCRHSADMSDLSMLQHLPQLLELARMVPAAWL
eukprot:COSAG02_NODE_341_length_24173_cov_28.504777_3_plen_51_part_00